MAALAQARIAQLETQVAQKTAEIAQSNNRIIDLETSLATSTAQNVASATRLGQLELKLTSCQTQLQQTLTQLEHLRTSEVARLTAASDWAKAATILKAQVTIQEAELVAVEATEDTARANQLSRALCDQHYQLGELYFKAHGTANANTPAKARLLAKAETYAKKAHEKRMRLLTLNAPETRRAQQLLCKILRKTGSDGKIQKAAALYREFWERQSSDEFVLECGYELGCLYEEQGRHGEALPLFRAVWEQRRVHHNPSEQALSMSTVEHLLSIEAPIERGVLLEQLWAGHTGPLAGTAMLKHADALARLLWQEKDYAKAKPVLEALWAVRADDILVPAHMPTAEKQARIGTWFITGYRYGNALTQFDGEAQTTTQLHEDLNSRAKAIFQRLWTERAKLPGSIAADVTIFKLADYYAGILLYFGYNKRAEKVAGTAWKLAIPANSETLISEDILHVGGRYAKALWKNADGKSKEALENSKKSEDIYKLLFEAWKELSRDHPQKRDLANTTIDCGESLLAILKARKRDPDQCKSLRAELKRLERAFRQSPASSSRPALGWSQ